MFAAGCIKTASQIQAIDSDGLLGKGKQFLQKLNLEVHAKVNFCKVLFSPADQSNALNLHSLPLGSLFLRRKKD